MKCFTNLLCVFIATFLIGCGTVDKNLKIRASETANPWTNLNLYNSPDNFQFAIVSDRTGGRRPGVFAKAVDKLNLLKPEFVICIGDLIDGYTKDRGELNNQWNQFDSLVNKLQMPFFYVPGNHDISNETAAQIWHKRLGRSYYHFIYHDVLFLCLNTEDPPATSISDRQIEYFKKVLAENKHVRWTLVFMHKPMWQRNPDNWQKVESLLSERNYTVFAGHEHEYSKFRRYGRRYYVLATTGAGCSGPDRKPAGLEHCEFDHVVWVTMTDDGPVLANLLLNGILGDEPCHRQDRPLE